MSEFQYYEFRKLDGIITTDEIKKIEQLSSKAIVVGNVATFTYHFGDFKHDRKKILLEYFDIMLYVANWGMKDLMFKISIHLVDMDRIGVYENDRAVEIEYTSEYAIVTLIFHEEDDWKSIDECDLSYVLTSMIGLRKALITRDYRALHMAWLKAYGEVDDPALADLPVPDNLADLTSELEAFAEFFELDRDVLLIAASRSAVSNMPNLHQLPKHCGNETISY